MERLLRKIKQFYDDLNQYYIDQDKVLYIQNFKMLRDVSLVVGALTTLMIFVTPFVITTWEPTPQHFGLAIFSVIFWLILSFIQKYNKVTRAITSIMCLIGGIMLFLFVIAIDIFPYKDQPSQFIQVVIIMLPLLFVFRFYHIFGFMLIFQIIDIGMLLQFKARHMAQNDIFSSIMGMLISLTAWCFFSKLRVDNYIIQDRYRTLSMTDSLTGILNKGACMQEIHSCLLQAAIKKECCVLLLIDIDNFKEINDSLGHQVGDDILNHFGGLLLRYFRSTDIVGRFGGDEFLVLLRNIQNIQDVNKRCDSLMAALPEISVDNGKSISCSMGIAVAQNECYDFDKLFKIADNALYKAKYLGRKRYVMGENTDRDNRDI